MSERTPLANWDDDDSRHFDLIWWARLDGRYQVEVQRVSDYLGILVVFDHNDGDHLIHSDEVGLSHGAIFGPDAGDVSDWKHRTMQVIDDA